MRSRLFLFVLLIASLIVPIGCGNSNTSENPADNSSASNKKPGLMERMVSKPVTVPAGTILTVRLGNSLSTKSSRTGDTFTATVAEPVSVDGKTVIPDGAEATGSVTDSQGMGHFKGGALLRIVLTSVTVKGQSIPVETSANSHSEKGKGKRSAVVIGGGAGLGALVGALAGGGKGAAIGAGVGAGAGGAVQVLTRGQQVKVPSETLLEFRLQQPVMVAPTQR